MKGKIPELFDYGKCLEAMLKIVVMSKFRIGKESNINPFWFRQFIFSYIQFIFFVFGFCFLLKSSYISPFFAKFILMHNLNRGPRNIIKLGYKSGS